MHDDASPFRIGLAPAPVRSERELRPRNFSAWGAVSEGGAAPLRRVYEPERMRRLGFEYHSVGRKPVFPT